jgi:hypothetical protein
MPAGLKEEAGLIFSQTLGVSAFGAAMCLYNNCLLATKCNQNGEKIQIQHGF